MARAEVKVSPVGDALGEDLAALLGRLPAGIASITPITSLAAHSSRRASFRIALDNGAIVKGRRFDSSFEAERFARLTRHLAHPQIPAAIAQRGAAVIEPWTVGQSLAGKTIALAEIRALGALLASIHVAPPPAGSERDIDVARAEREHRLESNIGRLVDLKRIDGDFAAQIRAAATPVPSDIAVGLIHGDFCPENLVRTEGGIVAVDNETLRFEALDYDLARTWYRWRMDGAQARAFLDGYGAQRAPDGFLQHFPYWATCAMVDSAVFRAGAGIADVDKVLWRLGTFVRQRPAFSGNVGDAP
ncbi:MAG TPA: aminoglycoside phosphotransferase family protein [Alphaproteobacteria bacterium]|nr:aminoglycoside phosphotransferase family protein [Alphaproteobacteria bacterium]